MPSYEYCYFSVTASYTYFLPYMHAYNQYDVISTIKYEQNFKVLLILTIEPNEHLRKVKLYLNGAVGASVLGFKTATLSNAWHVSFTRAKSCSPRWPKPEAVSTSKLLEIILGSELEKHGKKNGGQLQY